MSDLGYNSTHKGDVILCVSSCTVAPTITYICFRARLLMINVKSCYLQYEVAGDQFCGWIVSSLNHMRSGFAFSCCYFETADETSAQLEMYIQEVVLEGHVLTNCMYIILKFLLASIFFTIFLLCDMLNPENILH